MKLWAPIRAQRAKLYKDETGKECPDWILWLTKKGKPLYYPPGNHPEGSEAQKRVIDAFTYVSTKKRNPLKEVFGFSVSYYTMRHTYATNFLIRHMEATNNFDKDHFLSDIRLQEDLADQMGHKAFKTTMKHYIINSVVILHKTCNGEQPRQLFTMKRLTEFMGKRKARG